MCSPPVELGTSDFLIRQQGLLLETSNRQPARIRKHDPIHRELCGSGVLISSICKRASVLLAGRTRYLGNRLVVLYRLTDSLTDYMEKGPSYEVNSHSVVKKLVTLDSFPKR
jgi:hypothetical protein